MGRKLREGQMEIRATITTYHTKETDMVRRECSEEVMLGKRKLEGKRDEEAKSSKATLGIKGGPASP